MAMSTKENGSTIKPMELALTHTPMALTMTASGKMTSNMARVLSPGQMGLNTMALIRMARKTVKENLPLLMGAFTRVNSRIMRLVAEATTNGPMASITKAYGSGIRCMVTAF